jgi:hypothetical protein
MRLLARAGVAVLVAVLVVLVATRRLVLVDWSSSDTLGFLQQLFTAQITVAALIGTGISIVLQFRSTRFGSAVLFHLVWTPLFAAATIAVIASTAFTGVLLGNWRTLHLVHEGLLPDLAELMAVSSMCALFGATLSRLAEMSNDDAVARHIASMTRRKSWRAAIQKEWEAEPIRWLMEGLRAARASGDLVLFRRLLVAWVRELSESEPYRRIRQDTDKVVLSGPDTDYMVAVDFAHDQLFLGLTLAAERRREFDAQFELLAELAFPAFSKDSEYHLREPRPFAPVRPVSFQTVIPGVMTLGELTSRAVAADDLEFASVLLRQYWGPAAAAAVRLSERIIDWSDYSVTDRALISSVRFILTQYIEAASTAGKQVVRNAVSVALLTVLAEAELEESLRDFSSEFGDEIKGANVEEAFGEQIGGAWIWQMFLRVAEKKQAPVYTLCLIARDIVGRSGEPLNYFKFGVNVDDDILRYLVGVMRAINRSETWQFLEESMVTWLWKYLEDHYARTPSTLGLPSVLNFFDEGPFYTTFQDRYEFSCEVLTEKGKAQMNLLKEAFVRRYREAESQAQGEAESQAQGEAESQAQGGSN